MGLATERVLMAIRLVPALKNKLLGEPKTTPYVCFQCDSQFKVEHYSCPECGGYRVERTEWAYLR
jgi:rRNA maturation endonuclease Nob1